MADDPLAGQNTQPTASADPLAGWQPGPVSAADTSPPPPPQKGILETSYPRGQPSATNKPDLFARDPDVQNVRGAFGEGYSSVPESVTRPGERSILYPETQKNIANTWWGPAVNLASDTAGTALGGIAGVGNSIYTLGNQALSSVLPPSLVRDINVEGLRRVGEPTNINPWRADAPAFRELSMPPTPSTFDVWKDQRAALRAATPPDPVTAAAVAKLRQLTGTSPPLGTPTPPTPFTTTPGPTPAPSGGLLDMPPSPAAPPPRVPVPMTADEILARSQGFYSPADKQAAQGATIGASSADGIRGVLTDAVPTDPQKAAAVGSTPLIQLGKDYQQFQGQPMSYDTAMALDRRLTDERQAAVRSGNNTLASQIEDAQGKIRDKVQSVDPSDTTGDPTALAALPQARQAYAQYIKQRQIEDLKYDASLLPDDKQSAYLTSRGNAMLRGNQTRNWTDDERGAFEQALKGGQIGTLTNVGLGMIKPAAQAAGAAIGGSVFGTPGAIVGGQIGGGVSEPWVAKLRAALKQVTLDPVSRAISQGVPPPGQ